MQLFSRSDDPFIPLLSCVYMDAPVVSIYVDMSNPE